MSESILCLQCYKDTRALFWLLKICFLFGGVFSETPKIWEDFGENSGGIALIKDFSDHYSIS